MNKPILAAAVIALLTAVSHSIDANPLPAYQIWEAVQNGGGAIVAVEGPPLDIDWDEAISLERESGMDRDLIAQEVQGSDVGLSDYCPAELVDEVACAEPGASCFDCDEDEVMECTTSCIEMYLFYDDCLPPGDSEYHLYLHWEISCYEADTEAIVGEDFGQECPLGNSDFECIDDDPGGDDVDVDVDSDADTDTDSDTDSDADTNSDSDEDDQSDDDGGESCSFVPSAGTGSSLLSLLMSL